MTRKKVTLAYITNDSERKASFKKRKKGLIKKASELSTLCGVDACVIIYSPYEADPAVWPSRQGAEAVLSRFRRLPEMDQTRKMVNQESFTRQRIKKAEDQLRRVQKENKRRELENFMLRCLAGLASLEEFDLRDSPEMGWVVNQMLRDITSRMEAFVNDGNNNNNKSNNNNNNNIIISNTEGVNQQLPNQIQASEALIPPPQQQVMDQENVYIPLPLQTEENVYVPDPLQPVEPSSVFLSAGENLARQPPYELMPPHFMTAGEHEHNMESFPWNLVESPSGAGCSGLDGGGLGWDQGMVLPYPYIFNNGANDAPPAGERK